MTNANGMSATHVMVMQGTAEGEIYKVVGEFDKYTMCINEFSGSFKPFSVEKKDLKSISAYDYKRLYEAADDDTLWTKLVEEILNGKLDGIPIVARMGELELELGRVLMPRGPGDVCRYNWNNSDKKFDFDFDCSTPTGYNEGGDAQVTLIGWYATDFDEHVFLFNGYDVAGDFKAFMIDTSEEAYNGKQPVWVAKELNTKLDIKDAFIGAINK